MDLRKNRITATLGVALSGALAAASIATAAPATASTAAGDADAAAGWLAGQFVDGMLSQYGTPNRSVTLDGILGLTSRKVAAGVAKAVTDGVESDLLGYISPDGGSSRTAGAVAKVALIAIAQNRDPRAFGGEDLVSTLTSLRRTSAPYIGAFGNSGPSVAAGDGVDTFTQSLALTVESRLGIVGADDVAFLVNKQCANGGFGYVPDATPAACGSDYGTDNDSTAMAVAALSSPGVKDEPGVAAAITKAADFLESQQKPNGAFPATGWITNANTTGLAVLALRAAGRSASATSGANWLASLQFGCGDLPTSASQYVGAVAYDPDSRATIVSSGVDSTNADQLRFANTQAVLGFPGSDSFATMSSTGSSSALPTLTCTQPRTAPLAPTLTGITYASSLKSSRVVVSGPAGADVLFRVRKGATAAWSTWKSGVNGAFDIPTSKTVRYVEVIARDSGGDSPVVSLLIQARSSMKSRRGCQAIGAVTIAHPTSKLATASFAPRKKSCAAWRLNGKGSWKTVKKGASSVNFKVARAVGVNWEVRTGQRVVAISVRAPR